MHVVHERFVADISRKFFCVTSPNDVIIHQLLEIARVAYPTARKCLSETIRKWGHYCALRWRKPRKVDSENLLSQIVCLEQT